jgi:isopenicillin-N epimerase
VENRFDFDGASPAMGRDSGSSCNLIHTGRRDFMRVLGAGAGLAALGPLVGCGSSSNAATPIETLRADLVSMGMSNQVRGGFVFPDPRLIMNVGTSGSMPQRVLDRYQQENLEAARLAPGGYGNLAQERAAVAPGLGMDPDELVFSYNTSDGMCQIILGLEWQPGDVVVTTNHEHGGGNTPLNIAAARYGIEIHRVALPTGEIVQEDGSPHNAEWYFTKFDRVVTDLRNAGKRVRALMWSSPTYLTGTMLPIRELVEVCKKHELISIVDGAHLPGMMHYDYRELGVDFMSGAGHKWQCGPGSTGILFIRNKVRPSNPLPLPKYWPITTSSFNPAPPAWYDRATQVGQEPTYNIANAVQSLGSMNIPMFRALTEACEMWDEIGRQDIEKYVVTLGTYLKEKVVEKWGEERLYSPRKDPRLTCALTSFNPFINHDDIYSAEKSSAMVNSLRDKGFGVRNTSVPAMGHAQMLRPLRISTHLWHSPDDVDALVDAIWQTANELNA